MVRQPLLRSPIHVARSLALRFTAFFWRFLLGVPFQRSFKGLGSFKCRFRILELTDVAGFP